MLEALTYEMPADVAVPPVGSRVLVPVGSRIMTGCVLGPANGAGPTSTDAARIKQVVDVLDDGAFLPGDVIVLASWVADYYACGVGEAVAAAMPPRAWVESERHARITDLGRTRIDDERGLRRSLLEKLQGGAPMRVSTLGAAGRGVHGALATLERDGFIELTQPLKGRASAYRTVRLVSLTAQGHDIADGDQSPVASESQPAGTVDKGPALRLGERQRAALDHLRGAPDGIEASELRREGIGAQTLSRLSALGLISFSRKRV